MKQLIILYNKNWRQIKRIYYAFCAHFHVLLKVRHLGSVSGKDVVNTTRHFMRDLMTNAVAARMNFIGRGGKTAIKNMTLLKAIIGNTS